MKHILLLLLFDSLTLDLFAQQAALKEPKKHKNDLASRNLRGKVKSYTSYSYDLAG